MKAATKTKSGDKSQNGQLITVTLNKALSACNNLRICSDMRK
jgi:hypothetical protein